MLNWLYENGIYLWKMLFSITIDKFKSQFQYKNKKNPPDGEPTVRDGVGVQKSTVYQQICTFYRVPGYSGNFHRQAIANVILI